MNFRDYPVARIRWIVDCALASFGSLERDAYLTPFFGIAETDVLALFVFEVPCADMTLARAPLLTAEYCPAARLRWVCEWPSSLRICAKRERVVFVILDGVEQSVEGRDRLLELTVTGIKVVRTTAHDSAFLSCQTPFWRVTARKTRRTLYKTIHTIV